MRVYMTCSAESRTYSVCVDAAPGENAILALSASRPEIRGARLRGASDSAYYGPIAESRAARALRETLENLARAALDYATAVRGSDGQR